MKPKKPVIYTAIHLLKKVRDHCHETGKYRGPARKMCNLRYKQQKFIPIILHNGSGCDFNLLHSDFFK